MGRRTENNNVTNIQLTMITNTDPELVVCLAKGDLYRSNKENRPEGFMTHAKVDGRGIKYTAKDSDRELHAKTHDDCFRLATEEEIIAYTQGIRFIKDIKKQLPIFN